MSAREHLNENKVIYALLAVVTGGGGVATLTDNLPVTQREYQEHLVQYDSSSEELEDIGKKVDTLLLQQLKQSLRQVYADKCKATDAQAIQYIDQEIEGLQESYETITGRRYVPPPCEVTP